MTEEELYKIISEDKFDLLVPEKKQALLTDDDRLVASFEEINKYVDQNGSEPRKSTNIQERKLATRLETLRSSDDYSQILTQYDRFGLLSKRIKTPETITDIFDDDPFGLLDIEEDSILSIKNVPILDRNSPEFIAKRRPCKNFKQYEDLFVKVHSDLSNGTKGYGDITHHTELQPGTFFLLGGIVGYITDSEKLTKDEKNRIDARLHVVFENGTESNMFLQSLRRSIQKEGGRIIRDTGVNEIAEEDIETGHIYVLRSLSKDPQLVHLKDLYKIGFSRGPVNERVKNAENETTYLMAPVETIIDYTCFNMSPQRFERLVHRFFGDSSLDIEINNNEGLKYRPKEWFVVPLPVIEEAIDLMVTGKIVEYSYDKVHQKIVKKV